MVMRCWTPASEVPKYSVDYNTTVQTQRTFLRWCRVIVSTLIAATLVSFCIVYTLQRETFFRKEYEHKQQEQQQLVFDRYIQDISNILLQTPDEKVLLHIQTQTLMLLRNLDVRRKKDVILFLYERNIIQNNQLNLRAADLNNVELICPHDFHHLHLSEVIWSNAIFVNCRLTSAVFDRAHLVNARFINSTLMRASFIETNLDHSQFIQTIIMNNSFQKASLIQANFLQADFVQGNNFTNADLYQAKITNDQLEGKKMTVVKHDFHHARFPNGSFNLFNSEENLIVNGNAEMECYADQQLLWKSIDRNSTLSIRMNDNNYWGNCSFVILDKTQVYQVIDLDTYSLLIDKANAGFSFTAFASCEKPYFAIHMYRPDGILHELKVYSKLLEGMKPYGNTSMYSYGVYRDHIPIHTRLIYIYFGIKIFEDGMECYFDNITFTIYQK